MIVPMKLRIVSYPSDDILQDVIQSLTSSDCVWPLSKTVCFVINKLIDLDHGILFVCKTFILKVINTGFTHNRLPVFNSIFSKSEDHAEDHSRFQWYYMLVVDVSYCIFWPEYDSWSKCPANIHPRKRE